MSTDPNALDQTLLDAAQGPAEAVIDGQSAKQHPLPDLIEAAKFLASKSASSNPFGALRITTARPGSAVGKRHSST